MVKVSIDNQNDEITIRGAGVHEVRLRPGQHQLTAVKDGRIKRGDVVVLEAMGGGFTWGAAALRY